MNDLLGNPLVEGQLILWRSTGLVGRIVKIGDSDLSVDRTGAKKRPSIKVEFDLSLDRGTNPDFYVVVDPNSAALVERAVGG